MQIDMEADRTLSGRVARVGGLLAGPTREAERWVVRERALLGVVRVAFVACH